jgi:hypothetical protein
MKNTLIQYQGGGYDGCIWEWNYAVYDQNGQFHNIFSSGRMGCRNDREMKRYLSSRSSGESYYLYNLNPKALNDFVRNSNPAQVKGVGKYLKEHLGLSLVSACPFCGKQFEVTDMKLEGFEGDGGIGLTATLLLCEDCYFTHTCVYCGSFFEELENLDLDSGYCKYCAQEIDTTN